jgi:hypothetical protein
MSQSLQLQKIIAVYSPFSYSDIDLSKKMKDKYVAAEFKDSLADDLCNQWPQLDCTRLHNELFSSIKTGNDILELLED